MPGTVYTRVDSVSYGAGWTRTPLEGGGYKLTATGGPTSDATIKREDPFSDVEVVDAPVGTTITVTGDGTADVHQP